MLIPICRPGGWELKLVVDYQAANVAHKIAIVFGYITNSGHIGAYTTLYDADDGNTELVCGLRTNDGDDTFTARYDGAALAGTGSRTYAFRQQNGCLRAYDEQDDAWHDYTGRQVAGISYTAAWAFVQVYKLGASVLSAAYIANLKLTYLL